MFAGAEMFAKKIAAIIFVSAAKERITIKTKIILEELHFIRIRK